MSFWLNLPHDSIRGAMLARRCENPWNIKTPISLNP